MARLARYRVNAAIAGLKLHELVEIDPAHQHWAPLIERGYLSPEIPPMEPFAATTSEPAMKPAPRKRASRPARA